MKRAASFIGIALLASGFTLTAFHFLGFGSKTIITQTTPQDIKYVQTSDSKTATLDFTYAAEKATPVVVHIKSTTVEDMHAANPMNDLFNNDFFRFFPQPGPQERRSESSGSGVLISSDGYIVTNNHVVKNATDIEITLWDKNTFPATVIGTDPSTDLALIKIDGSDLPFVNIANSDEVRVGEWVLAVGNPFNLESTVTAGIVSAKGRNINILKEQYSIESFIQTDAAVNPGNSGGALVDLDGNLIGINTAIATPTGSYAGYSFAVPSNIVKKVSADLKEYGIVQRGFLGVQIRNVDGNVAKELKLNVQSGVYVDKLTEDGAAKNSGIEEGDVIVKIDGKTITATPELQEAIASKKPGDKLDVTVNRDGSVKTISVTLKNKDGDERILEKEDISGLTALGIDLKELDKSELSKLGIDNGVKVNSINEGKIKRDTRMRPGFVITKIDGKVIAKSSDIQDYLMQKKRGGVMIEGVYPGIPGKTYYAVGIE